MKIFIPKNLTNIEIISQLKKMIDGYVTCLIFEILLSCAVISFTNPPSILIVPSEFIPNISRLKR